MESNRDRPHSHPITTLSSSSNTNTTNEQQQQLLLCFTSRLSSSSSSMKISKSILSPGRSVSEISLSSSLSRRLKTNGSLKGGQSPMFPATTTTVRKKTGAGFENSEPSSPKVTCIGQVRVKSKKKKTNHHHHSNNIRSRSQRRSADYSFRRIDGAEDANNGLTRQSSTSYRNREIEIESSQRHGHNNQKWVHIPVTICESLKSFGSDFNCFLPCRSSSCVSHKEHQQQQQQGREAEKQLGCGSLLARWLVAVQDDAEGGAKGGRQRQIEVVVGRDDDDEELCGRRSYRKRHVMEDIDIKEIERNLREKVESLSGRRDEIVEGGRASICIPPKNALLLMRCGSDHVKMAALANRFWEPPEKEEQVQVEEEEDIHEIDEQQSQMVVSVIEENARGVHRECETEQQAASILIPVSDEQVVTCDLDVRATDESISSEPEMKCEDENILCENFVIEEMYHDVLDEELSSAEMELAVTGEEVEHNGMEINIEHRIEAGRDSGEDQVMGNAVVEEITVEDLEEADQLVTSPSSEEQEESGDIILTEQSKQVDDYRDEATDEDMNSAEVKQDTSPTEKEKESSALPDCLLPMMCEPKLSMEVSQETWVCTTDFIRWLPPREVNKTTTTNKKIDGGRSGAAAGGGGDELSKRVSIHYNPPKAPPQKPEENPQFIPPRSSCSYPAPPAKHESACEPLYNLTRCKSEPRRAAANLAAAGTQESCFWKNRPHSPVGVGAAGMGV